VFEKYFVILLEKLINYIMCFSESQSYLNTFLLVLGGIYKINNYRLCIPSFFLAIKDLIQGLLYHYIDVIQINKLLTKLSWIHICFQPFIVNLLFSNFSLESYHFWNFILFITFIYGIFTLSTLYDFNKNIKVCIKTDKKNDFCSLQTISYLGNYHLGYRFKMTNDKILFPIIYLILMIVPALFTKSAILSIIWVVFVIIIYILSRNNSYVETAAMWCFLSIIFFLPLSLYEEKIKSILIEGNWKELYNDKYKWV